MTTKFVPFLLATVAALLLAAAPLARADGTIYTSQSDFTLALNPGAYTENFSDFSDSNFSPDYLSATLTNGTYTAIVTTTDIYGQPMYPYITDLDGNPFMTVGGGSVFAKSITLTFTSGNVNAIGGSFFYTGGFGDIVDAPITLTFSDGTSQVLTDQDNDSFFGYIGTEPIASLTLTSDASNHYGSLDNLILGSAAVAVPEPCTWPLVAGGLALLAVLTRRRKAGTKLP